MGPSVGGVDAQGRRLLRYKLQAAVCAKTGLPVSWSVETARANESMFVAPLIDAARSRGFAVETASMDRAYDITRVYDECADRDCLPIIPLRQTGAVKRGDHLPPSVGRSRTRTRGRSLTASLAARLQNTVDDETIQADQAANLILHPLFLPTP